MKKVNWIAAAFVPLAFIACSKDDDKGPVSGSMKTITVENVLDAKTLVESGIFQHEGSSPLTMPGETVSFKFSASFGQSVSFACMYGASNDLFFAPENPGIALYDDNKKPIEGDVSGQIKLWDNGSRINQKPGASVVHPGVTDNQPIAEVKSSDAQGNAYLPASSLVKATLKYEGDSYFTLTITNNSGGTLNETPLSPGVWAISYIAGGDLLNAAPLYAVGETTTSGLTKLAEAGDNSEIAEDTKANTGIFTPLSPILVVVYNGIDNPLFKEGEADADEGLADLAQKGDASRLATSLEAKQGVKKVYVLPAPNSTILLPKIGDQPGSSVSQQLDLEDGDQIAIASMYGFSNDWFFATTGNGTAAGQSGDISGSIKLFDNGTAVDQFPGAGNTQFNLGGTPQVESKPIAEVPNPNAFTTLPTINQLIKVTLQ